MARQGPWQRDPTAPFSMLQAELQRLIGDYWNPARFTTAPTPPVDPETAAWTPPIDLVETPEAFLLLAEVPGVDPSAIDLSLTGNVLTIRGDKSPDEGGEPTSAHRERIFGPFHRQVVLPGEVDFEATQAEARNGVLKIKLPKRAAARPRTIPVEKR
jgi:HSP20 family protein